MKMKARRLLAFLLTAVMTFTLLAPVQADDLTAGETAPAATVESVTLPVSEKIELNSDAAGDSQWQIRAGDDLWVDISGADEATLQLSYSMVANLLTDGTAAVRCKTTNGDQVSYGSEYQVTVDFDAVPQFEPAPQPDPASLVISEAQAVPQDTAETPAEDAGEPEQVNESEAAILQAEEAMQAAEEALLAAEGVATSESAMTDEQLAALEEARANYEAAKAAYDEAVAASTSSQVAPMMAAAPAAPQNEGDPEVKPECVIQINYVFSDGDTAATSWSAQYLTGDLVDAITVNSPEVLGYEPSIEAIDLTSIDTDNLPEGVTASGTGTLKDGIITGDVTFTVTYYPADVNYTVEYYYQNLDDDNYTLESSVVQTGKTESIVGGNLAPEVEGFVALLYDENTRIAADGSTVVEIYYDRKYYLMTFDLGGGYGVEPIYARYGTPIEVGTPMRPGYTFTEWQLNGESAVLPVTMPAENRNYVAQWQAADQAKVTLVFWGENANDEQYSYLSSQEIFAKPGEEYTYDLAKPICGLEEHTHTEESCGVGNCTHTQHDVGCYSAERYTLRETDRPNQDLTDHGNGIWYYDTTEEGFFGTKTERHWYLQIGNTWYCAYRERLIIGGYVKEDTQEITYNCQHQHTDACYSCGKQEHTHTDSCYQNVEGIDTRLWRFVRSDTVTVAADGSSIVNVYFDRTEFTMQFGKPGRYSDPDFYGTIKAKWGANIGNQFKEMCQTAGTYMWSTDPQNASSPWTGYWEIMPQENRTYYANEGGSGSSTAYYYTQNLNGQYELLTSVEVNDYGLGVSVEDMYSLKGFTLNEWLSSKEHDNFNGAKFYYDRNSYTLKFFNNGQELSEYEKTLKYEEPLKEYYFVPEYPSNLEPGAYEFGGWYNAPYFTEDSRVDFDSDIMPANDLMLYANWVPVDHDVSFHLDYTEDGLGEQVGITQTVAHGSTVQEGIPTESDLRDAEGGKYQNAGYTFVGWFYRDENDVEKAFIPTTMPVNRDLDLYAKWSSNVLKPYVIRYFTYDAEGNKVYIADDTTGSALAGTTKTFEAKGGSQLDAGYQEGYFPLIPSHSLTIDINDDNETPQTNYFEFEYVARKFVGYTVRYVDEAGKDLADPYVAASTSAVVTETYQFISGYMPDAYQKRLVLTPAPEDIQEDDRLAWEQKNNVIKFVYHTDNVHAIVHVEHYIQNIEGEEYTLYDENDYMDAVIGNNHVEDVLAIPGFAFASSKTEPDEATYDAETGSVTIKVTAGGLVLKLYYDREMYPYEFRYLEQGTETELHEPKGDNARYQAQVSETALNIPGYTCVTSSPQSMIIAVEEGGVADNNVRTFYYTENEATIHYVAVGPEGATDFGNVSPASESVKVFTGAAQGSTPTAGEGYRFVGWFTDEECTQPANTAWVNADTNTLTPQRAKNYADEGEEEKLGFEDGVTYYAKFEADTAPLTITKTINDPNYGGAPFLFHITNGDGFSMDVLVPGNGSVTINDLQVGETYTVTEDESWAWRYSVTGENLVTIEASGSAVTFTNTIDNDKWFDHTTSAENQWSNGEVSQVAKSENE